MGRLVQTQNFFVAFTNDQQSSRGDVTKNVAGEIGPATA